MSRNPWEVNSLDELESLPDGSIVTWISRDAQLEVAVVRSEVQYSVTREDEEAGIREQVRVVWLSNGTAVEAVTYPARVIRYGHGNTPTATAGELEPPEFFELTHSELLRGGTWAREKALECATHVYRGLGHSQLDPVRVTSLAEKFEAWLNRAVDQPDRNID